MEPVTLTTERLLLRPPTPADIDEVLAACQDPEIRRWTTVPFPYERQHAVYFVEHLVVEGWRTGTALNFCLRSRGGGPLLGVMGVRKEGSAWEIGYWTVREHRGHGYTAEAVTAVARWSFTALGVDRLEWRAEVGNEGSRAVAKKAGFVMEGVLRAALLHRETLRDAWLGALLPADLGLAGPHPYLPSRPEGADV